jgi:hypothetical protein
MHSDELLHIIAGAVVGGGEPRMGEFTGTKALMLAVLEDGIRTYCGPIGRARTEAEAWVYSNRRWPFGFTVVCEALNLEPEAVRSALRRLPAETLQGRSMRRLRGNARRHRPSVRPRGPVRSD